MSSKSKASYFAGVQTVDITPHEPVPLHGFGDQTLFTGIYQNLLVKALALSDGRNRLAIVTADLGFWPVSVMKEIRKRLAKSIRLPARSLLLNASHTHCGPCMRDEKPIERAYMDSLVDKTVEIVEKALATAAPARIFFGRGQCDMAVSRRSRDRWGYFVRGINPYGQIDPEVGLLKVTRANGRPIAVLFNFGCHNTSISGYKIGGDWAGFAHRFVEKKFPGATALFMQGCGGDLKVPNCHKDDPYRFGYGGGPAEAARWGRRLAGAVTKGLAGPLEEIHGPISSKLSLVDLPLMDKIEENDPEAKPFQAPHRRMARLAKSLLRSLDKKGNYRKTVKCEANVTRIGRDFVLVGLNGEMAIRIGLRIKNQLIPRPVLVAAYTNARWDEIGYVPSADMIPEEGYEAYTPYSLEMEDFLVGSLMTMAGEGRKRPRDGSAPLRKYDPMAVKISKAKAKTKAKTKTKAKAKPKKRT